MKIHRICKSLIFAITLFSCLWPAENALVYGADITVRKAAAEENPPLYISSLNMPGKVRKLVRSTLRRCDWFNIVSSRQNSGYTLSAAYRSRGEAKLRVQIGQGGRTVTSFVISSSNSDVRNMVYRAVDTVIQKVFDNPGLCHSKIGFVMGKNGRKEIFTCNFDGSNIKQLTYNGTISTEPDWGPGGRFLTYTFYDGSRTKTVLVDTRRGRQRIISAYQGLNSGGAISPTGNMIALSLSRKGTVDLYIKPLQGSGLYRLTDGSGVESSPAWSPEGNRLCYVSDRAGRPHLYLIGARGGNNRRLTGDAAEEVSPDWSRVSNKICMATRKGGRYRIAVVNMNDEQSSKQIIDCGAGDWEAPSWAPDGRHVTCTRNYAGQTKLFMVDTVTGKAIPVLQGGDVSLPSWTVK